MNKNISFNIIIPIIRFLAEKIIGIKFLMKVYMLEMKYQKNYPQAYNIAFQNIDKKNMIKLLELVNYTMKEINGSKNNQILLLKRILISMNYILSFNN